MDLNGILERVERKLGERGLSASAASKAAGKPEAIRNLQRAVKDGKRQGITTATIAALAPVLGTTASWLMEGGEESPRQVPIVGYVGAGAEAHLFGNGQGPFGEIEAPEGSTDKTVAVEIRGESLGSFFDRWIVFYNDVRDPPGRDMIGKLCVVGLDDGRILIKKLAKGSNAKNFTLLSQFESPIFDVRVEWAARVTNMVPR